MIKVIKDFKTLLKRLTNEESGQGMVEYGLIILLIALVAITAINVFGQSVKTLFENANNQIP